MTEGPSGDGWVVALAVASGILLAACTGGAPSGASRAMGGVGSGTTSPTVSSAPSVSPVGAGAARIRILSLGGDAWAWRERIDGRFDGDCRQVAIRVNGTAVHGRVVVKGKRFTADVPLRGHADSITAVCSRTGGRVERSDPITFTERLRPDPIARIHVGVRGGTVMLDGAASRPSHEGGPIVGYAWSAGPDNPAPLSLAGGGRLSGVVHSSLLSVVAPRKDGDYYVSLTVTDAHGRKDSSTTYFVISHGAAHAVDVMTERPAWVNQAVVYGVAPFLFGNDGFKSVQTRLPYLKRLGINTIWLSPINATTPGDFGYAVTDYFSLNPQYGTKADFRRLVQAAHAQGIRVMMDFVPNHTSSRHPYFRQALEYGPRSHYYDFYDRKPNGKPTHYFDWHNLPNLNYDNPEVRRMILSAFEYWVRKFDVDGFRVDAAWGVRLRDPSFWPFWRRQLKRIKPDLFLLAEASARDPWYFSHGFDAAYDWTQHLGQWAWSDVFGNQTTVAQFLNAALTNLGSGYPRRALVFRFLNNNDTGQRFVGQYGPDFTRVAAALLLTLPGVPLIYTGDEVGAMYMPYFDNYPIQWKDQFDLRSWYRRLIHLRERMPSLTSREWQPVPVEPSNDVYAYVRWAGRSDAPVFVLLNFAGNTFDVRVSASADLHGLARTGRVRDILTGHTFRLRNGRLPKIRMRAYSALILVPQGRSG